MPRSLGLMVCLVGVLSAFVYGFAQHRLSRLPRASAGPELLIALPRFAQVLLAGGDRYLAANLAGFRVLVAETEQMGPADYVVQGRLQRDIAWFNPAHEDNFYIAAAMLAWNGQVDAAQYVLRRASEARIFDWYPLFQYGFLYYHFRKDPATGAQLLLKAVPRAKDQQDEWALQNLAAVWIEKGYQTASAARLVGAMAADSAPGAFRNYLEVRARRLRELAALQEAATLFQQRYGRRIASLDDLVSTGLIAELPNDPLGNGFTLDASGWPILGLTAASAK